MFLLICSFMMVSSSLVCSSFVVLVCCLFSMGSVSAVCLDLRTRGAEVLQRTPGAARGAARQTSAHQHYATDFAEATALLSHPEATAELHAPSHDEQVPKQRARCQSRAGSSGDQVQCKEHARRQHDKWSWQAERGAHCLLCWVGEPRWARTHQCQIRM